MAEPTDQKTVIGFVELSDKGYGFLRHGENNYQTTGEDVFLTKEVIHHYGLQPGLELVATLAKPKGKKRTGPRVKEVLSINGRDVEEWKKIINFTDHVAIDPCPRIQLETPGGPMEMRMLDLITPVGYGQRGIIVAPPRSGKTVLLQQIAHGVSVNAPDAKLFILLVDERPEEVTEFRMNCPYAEVVASCNDNDIHVHTRVAVMTIERARRMAEFGEDVIILLDSITRLGRAFNRTVKDSGRTMSGGVDIRALEIPKRLFGSARKLENSGSVTIIATALVETGSRMDDVIFEEFKGTGNMELQLDRRMAEMRVWPAIDIPRSGTRKEELLMDEFSLAKIHKLRRMLSDLPVQEEVPTMLKAIGRFETNADFLANFNPER